MKLRLIRASIALTVFALVCGLACFIAWTGGYDFDKRHPDVAFGAMMAIMFGGFLGVLAGYSWDSDWRDE